MITTIFGNLLYMFGTILNKPAYMWDLPANWYVTLTLIVSYMKSFDGLIPVSDMLLVLLVIISFEIMLKIVKLLISFLNWIRGAGGIQLDF